jgi:predicted nucleic-acid-binding protein
MTRKKQREMGYPWRVWWTPAKKQGGREKQAPRNDYFKRLLATEEGRKLHKMWTDKRFAPGVKMGRPQGATSGYNKTERREIKRMAKEEAERIISYMENEKNFVIPKQDFAREAITTAVEILRREDINVKDKLTAAKVVLEYTLAKPATETTVNVKTAESFLDEIAAEMSLKK